MNFIARLFLAGSVEKLTDVVVYKFQSKDEKGSHYLFVTPKGNKLEFVLDYEKSLGIFLVDSKAVSIIFIMKDDDCSKLAENGMKEYEACDALFDNSNSEN